MSAFILQFYTYINQVLYFVFKESSGNSKTTQGLYIYPHDVGIIFMTVCLSICLYVC